MCVWIIRILSNSKKYRLFQQFPAVANDQPLITAIHALSAKVVKRALLILPGMLRQRAYGGGVGSEERGAGTGLHG